MVSRTQDTSTGSTTKFVRMTKCALVSSADSAYQHVNMHSRKICAYVAVCSQQHCTCTHLMYIYTYTLHAYTHTALLTGDMLDAKSRVLERANRNAGHGYSAIYFWNSNDKYQFASGLLRLKGFNFVADVELPDTKWCVTFWASHTYGMHADTVVVYRKAVEP
jgi:hypothetical protein